MSTACECAAFAWILGGATVGRRKGHAVPEKIDHHDKMDVGVDDAAWAHRVLLQFPVRRIEGRAHQHRIGAIVVQHAVRLVRLTQSSQANSLLGDRSAFQVFFRSASQPIFSCFCQEKPTQESAQAWQKFNPYVLQAATDLAAAARRHEKNMKNYPLVLKNYI